MLYGRIIFLLALCLSLEMHCYKVYSVSRGFLSKDRELASSALVGLVRGLALPHHGQGLLWVFILGLGGDIETLCSVNVISVTKHQYYGLRLILSLSVV